MRIFLTGVSCVGTTTIGKKMGELLGIRFFDLDNEIESFFETSIERLRDCLIALPPSGLMGGYRGVKRM